MKSLIALWSCTANELAVRCCTSATRDITTVVSRAKHEGLWFLAVTLADFGKAFERCLDEGFVESSRFPGFAAKRTQGRDTGLPLFLGGFLTRVFDSQRGVLLDEPDIEAIYAIRQLTLMFSKIALPGPDHENGRAHQDHDRKVVDPSRGRAAISEYVQIENDVRAFDEMLDPQYLEDLYTMSNMLFGELFAKLDRDIQFGRTHPRHGPGVVADKLTSNGKWNQRTWTARLQEVIPFEDVLFPNRGEIYDSERELVNIVEPGQELPVKVTLVPKTLKTPRIIAIEPTAMQYAQQMIFRNILTAIKEDSLLYRLVGFDDQEPNRVLARKGSHNGDLATLDLSEASDRVSNRHVVAMLQDFPYLLAGVQASRSTKADVPGVGVLPLSKFASMGSALCFPMEAIVFVTICFLGIQRELSTTLSRSDVSKSFDGRVRVFGDDIIVPRDYVLSVVDELHTFGYKVNISKSFWTGRYRESCGREYFDGQDVSIVKIRHNIPSQRQDARGVIATVKARNQFYRSGLWQTVAYLDRHIEKLLIHFPNVAPTSPLLGRESFLGYQFQKLDPNYHSPLTKGYRVVAKPPPDVLEGAGAMTKCLLRYPPSLWGIPRDNYSEVDSVLDPRVDTEHLERSGRPKHVSIKLGWGPPA
uniref:RNA-directed RNA polymerase n=1 Tax=Leviviridae sp. TaxID=2027243 RepID=A0A514D8R7_9VIRU|nr:MAG: RNA-dependent RNA polymerase [Leviviridae sp.]